LIKDVPVQRIRRKFQLEEPVQVFKLSTDTWEDGIITKVPAAHGRALYSVMLLRSNGSFDPIDLLDAENQLELQVNDKLLKVNNKTVSDTFGKSELIELTSSCEKNGLMHLALERPNGDNYEISMQKGSDGFGFLIEEFPNTGIIFETMNYFVNYFVLSEEFEGILK